MDRSAAKFREFSGNFAVFGEWSTGHPGCIHPAGHNVLSIEWTLSSVAAMALCDNWPMWLLGAVE